MLSVVHLSQINVKRNQNSNSGSDEKSFFSPASIHLFLKERILHIFTYAYLAFYMWYYYATQNYEFVIYVFALVVLAFILVGVRKKLKLAHSLIWGFSLLGLLHLVAGSITIGDVVAYGWRIFPFYDGGGDFYILKMDQVVHFCGYVLGSALFYELLYNQLKPKYKVITASILAILLATGFGVFNEIIEFFVYTIIQDNGVGGYYNTGLDLTFNLAGSIAGVLISLRYGNGQKATSSQKKSSPK